MRFEPIVIHTAVNIVDSRSEVRGFYILYILWCSKSWIPYCGSKALTPLVLRVQYEFHSICDGANASCDVKPMLFVQSHNIIFYLFRLEHGRFNMTSYLVLTVVKCKFCLFHLIETFFLDEERSAKIVSSNIVNVSYKYCQCKLQK